MIKFVSIILGIVSASPPPPASLEQAAERGDMNALRRFLEDGADVESIGHALQHNRMEVYRYLRDSHGANVNSERGPLRRTALYHSLRSNNVATVREVIEDGASLAAKDDFKWTPLFQAIYLSDDNIIRELISRGADIHAIDDRGLNPLMSALFYRRKGIALELIGLGSDLNIQASCHRKTALIMAIEFKWEDVATAIVEAGADVNAADFQDTTPLIAAAKEGLVGIARTLIAKGADVNRISSCNDKYSALSAAVRMFDGQNRELMLLLLNEGRADPNLVHDRGETVLHTVAYEGYKGVARVLIENGADINRRDIYGRTPREAAEFRLIHDVHIGAIDPDRNEQWVAEFGP